jgi:carbonic anhydrase/acetyltransferase-like protein (isoleucine patch superfamily)
MVMIHGAAEKPNSLHHQKSGMETLQNRLETFLLKKPTIGEHVFVATGAVVIGDVTLGDFSSVWFNAVLRGDINRIQVGHHTNIQDNTVFHLADEFPCIVGNYVTVGHGAIVHACTVGDEVLVGMRAIILDGAVIGEQSLIGAGALVTPGTVIPPGSMVLGSPAKVSRALTPEERSGLKYWADKYVENSAFYLRNKVGQGAVL